MSVIIIITLHKEETLGKSWSKRIPFCCNTVPGAVAVFSVDIEHFLDIQAKK